MKKLPTENEDSKLFNGKDVTEQKDALTILADTLSQNLKCQQELNYYLKYYSETVKELANLLRQNKFGPTDEKIRQ